jgi:hypothetical protein
MYLDRTGSRTFVLNRTRRIAYRLESISVEKWKSFHVHELLRKEPRRRLVVLWRWRDIVLRKRLCLEDPFDRVPVRTAALGVLRSLGGLQGRRAFLLLYAVLRPILGRSEVGLSFALERFWASDVLVEVSHSG